MGWDWFREWCWADSEGEGVGIAHLDIIRFLKDSRAGEARLAGWTAGGGWHTNALGGGSGRKVPALSGLDPVSSSPWPVRPRLPKVGAQSGRGCGAPGWGLVEWEVFLPSMLNGVPLRMAHGAICYCAHMRHGYGYIPVAPERMFPGTGFQGKSRWRLQRYRKFWPR